MLEDQSDFALFCWDNNSSDETRDLIGSLKDERLRGRVLHNENVNQREPFFWFLDNAHSQVLGKVDDDILSPPGWMNGLEPLVSHNDMLGMVGCWTFMPEDWISPLTDNLRHFTQGTVLQCDTIGGTSFLARREVLKRYARRENYGIPIDRVLMTLNGVCSGYVAPPLFAHHMDDPRSPHCVFTAGGLDSPQSALTARRLGFRTVPEYCDWLEQDARQKIGTPFPEQFRKLAHRNGKLRRFVRSARSFVCRAKG